VPPRRLLVGSEPEVVAAYEAGETIESLARRHGCSTESIRSLLHARGVRTRPRGSPSPLVGREGEVAAAYREGATIRELVDRFGVNARTVRKVLSAEGVPMRPPGRKPG
jgi:transposase-like protein